MTERVVDKERFNFCEYFTAAGGGGAKSQARPAESDAQSRLEALFKKKS